VTLSGMLFIPGITKTYHLIFSVIKAVGKGGLDGWTDTGSSVAKEDLCFWEMKCRILRSPYALMHSLL
jgi:hypothetical protein